MEAMGRRDVIFVLVGVGTLILVQWDAERSEGSRRCGLAPEGMGVRGLRCGTRMGRRGQ